MAGFAGMLFFFLSSMGQSSDSIQTSAPKKKHIFLKKFAIPITLIGAGIYGTTDNTIINHNEVREERFEYYSKFKHSADNYLQFAPAAAVYVFDAFGLRGKHDWKQQTILLGRAQLIMMAFVMPLKKYAHVLRPDSSSFNSFPSGHTAQAFMAATFFHKEFGSRYPWVSAGMFTVAGSIGFFRILNNRHWVSDVLAGTGFGILSAELSYMLHKNRHFRGMPDAVIPTYRNGAIGCSMVFGL